MANDAAIRALLVQQLGVAEDLIDQVQPIDVALAAGDTLGVSIPLYRLRHLRGYQDVLRSVRDALLDQLRCADEVYVRARLRAGHGSVVRVGRLTPAFAAALADDLRHAPPDAWLDVSVPADFSDAEVAFWRRRLDWLLGPATSLVVRRAGEVGPDSPRRWDRMSHQIGSDRAVAALVRALDGGIAVAIGRGEQPRERRRFPI